MIASLPNPVPIEMDQITDPITQESVDQQHARFEQNWSWFKARAAGLFAEHRGKVICIAGQELFAADTTAEVVGLAKAAHPQDNGRFTMIIPREKAPRIYAN